MGLRVWGLLAGQGLRRYMQGKCRGGAGAGTEIWEDEGAPQHWHLHGGGGSEGSQRQGGRRS